MNLDIALIFGPGGISACDETKLSTGVGAKIESLAGPFWGTGYMGSVPCKICRCLLQKFANGSPSSV